MPGISQSDLFSSYFGNTTNITPELAPGEKPQPVPTLGQTAIAAFETHNPYIAKLVQQPGLGTDVTNATYDRYSAVKDTYYENQPGWINQNSDSEMSAWKSQIDHELDNHDILARGGKAGTLFGYAARIVDPLNLVPAAIGVKTLATAARIAETSVSGAIIGAGSNVMYDAMIHNATQMSEDPNLSSAFVGAVVGGIFGVGIGALSKPEQDYARSQIAQSLNIKSEEAATGTGGSAKVIQDVEIAGVHPTVLKAVTANGYLTGPAITSRMSENPYVRALGANMLGSRVTLKANYENIASPTAVNEYRTLAINDAAKLTLNGDKYYKQYLSEVSKIEGGVPKSFDDFASNVSWAAEHPNEKSKFDAVNAAAPEVREHFNKYGNALVENNMLDEGNFIDKHDSYFTTMIDNEKMLQKQDEVVPVFQDWIRSEAGRSKAELEKLESDLKSGTIERNANIEKQISDLTERSAVHGDELAISQMANRVYNSYLGRGDQGLMLTHLSEHLSSTKSAKFTKPITFNIPRDTLTSLDVTNRNAYKVASFYSTHAATMIAYKQALEGLGHENLGSYVKEMAKTSQIQEKMHIEKMQAVEQELRAAGKINEADKIKADGYGTSKYNDQLKQDIQHVEDISKVALGQYGTRGKFDGVFQNIRRWNSLRLLGNISLNSVPDLKRHFENGKFFSDGLSPMLQSVSHFNEGTKQLTDLVIAFEMEMDNTSRLLENTIEPGTIDANSLLTKLDRNFSKLTGIKYWDNFNRRIAAQMYMSRVMRLAENGGTEKEMAELAGLGLDTSTLKYVKNQFNRPGVGQRIDGSYIGNYHLWDQKNPEFTAFKTGLLRYIDSTVIRTNSADIPLWMQQNEWAKTLFQFRPFLAGTTSQQLIPNLQKRNADTFTGYTIGIGLGIAVTAMHSKLQGKEYNPNPAQMLVDGLSYSAILGLEGSVALDLIGAPSKYTGARGISTVFGPSTSLVSDIVSSQRALQDRLFSPDKPELTDTDIHTMERLVPYQNIWARSAYKVLTNQGK